MADETPIAVFDIQKILTADLESISFGQNMPCRNIVKNMKSLFRRLNKSGHFSILVGLNIITSFLADLSIKSIK